MAAIAGEHQLDKFGQVFPFFWDFQWGLRNPKGFDENKQTIDFMPDSLQLSYDERLSYL